MKITIRKTKSVQTVSAVNHVHVQIHSELRVYTTRQMAEQKRVVESMVEKNNKIFRTL